MAKASVKYKQVAAPIESVTITLNEKEAKTLVAILASIGGNLDYSPRKHSGAILNAIVNEVEYVDYIEERECMTQDWNYIIFKEYKQ